MKQLYELCECGESLYESEGNSKYNVILCLNWECRRHHEPQRYVFRSRKRYPSYPERLKKRRPIRNERYRELVKAGLPVEEAHKYRDRTSMTVEQIVEMLK